MLWRMLKVVPIFGQIYEKSTVPTLYAHGDLLPSACQNLQGPVDGICFLPKCGTNWEREMKVRQQESKNVTFIATEGSWRVWSRCGSPVGYLRLHPWIELTYLIIEGAGQPHGTAEQRRAACRQAKVKEKKRRKNLNMFSFFSQTEGSRERPGALDLEPEQGASSIPQRVCNGECHGQPWKSW